MASARYRVNREVQKTVPGYCPCPYQVVCISRSMGVGTIGQVIADGRDDE